jgi:hypothetical protein
VLKRFTRLCYVVNQSCVFYTVRLTKVRIIYYDCNTDMCMRNVHDWRFRIKTTLIIDNQRFQTSPSRILLFLFRVCMKWEKTITFFHVKKLFFVSNRVRGYISNYDTVVCSHNILTTTSIQCTVFSMTVRNNIQTIKLDRNINDVVTFALSLSLSNFLCRTILPLSQGKLTQLYRIAMLRECNGCWWSCKVKFQTSKHVYNHVR